MNERTPRRPQRPEQRDQVELRRLREEHPELAPAVDMQIEILEMQRRLQARVPLPRLTPDRAWLAGQVQRGRALVRFSDIPLEWTDFRLTLRQAADILRRHDAIERVDHAAIQSLTRAANTLEPIVTEWYLVTARFDEETPRTAVPRGAPAGLEQALILALRPFLGYTAEILANVVDLSAWRFGYCPFCGWEPEFSVITPDAERQLICGRCAARWGFDSLACPYCENHDRSRITSLATPDGTYRVSACDRCQRYLKAFDGRSGQRPLLLAYDTIATLPLDAAAQQRGYLG